jgi:polyketide synthase PksN
VLTKINNPIESPVMIDFIEYVVSELKSKRLSKENALDLINQFSHRSAANTRPVVIHPLLHTNTSDLSQQSFSSTFSGDEPFLKDHKIKGQKVLPGVAYLEMIRAAVEKAMPFQDGAIIELRNVVWAQPVVVNEVKAVTIALFAGESEIDKGQVYYEIYSTEIEGDVKETIHCQGQAVSVSESAPVRLDIEGLKEQMRKGKLESDYIYTAYSRLGLDYGPSHKGIKAILQGDGQLFVQLSLPAVTGPDLREYVLHPGMMDSALQSAIGLFGDSSQMPDRPSLPFALESLKAFSACSNEMFAWVRYAQGSRPNDKVIKLDIDLCDREGVVAVQMRGFSSRSLHGEIVVDGEPRKGIGTILAAPVWQTQVETALLNTGTISYTQQHVFLLELPHVKTEEIETILTQSKVVHFHAEGQRNIAERFTEYALDCFERIRDILAGKPQGKVLVQVVTPNGAGQEVFTGLSGLLKTAALENPQLIGQIVTTHSQVTAGELAAQLVENRHKPGDSNIKYELGARQVLHWQEIPAQQQKPAIAFKDNGVYVVTAGVGGLGILFAKEILQQTSNARIILTGRSGLTAEKQAVIDKIKGNAGRVVYQQLDVTNLDEVNRTINAIIKDYKALNGIFHCAGMISDSFILKKTPEEFRKVLAPKVTGTYNLDEATKGLDLDFLVLFSSISSITGNSGQADYAAANGFMDQFAACRNQLAEAGQRQGKAIAINWPLWEEGGMKVELPNQELIRQNTGMHPMRTETGLHAFYNGLDSRLSQMFVVEGQLQQLYQTLFSGKTEDVSLPGITTQAEKEAVVDMDAGSLEEKTQDYIKKQLSELFRIPSRKIDPYAPLEKYGIDSILAMNLTNQLEKTFGSLPKTLFFEYQTIRELTDYFVRSHRSRLNSLFIPAKNSDNKAVNIPGGSAAKVEPGKTQLRSVKRRRPIEIIADRRGKAGTEAIAIIGLSGRYPQAINIEEYWKNLRDGKDCITEVPGNRWNWNEYYSEDRSKSGYHYSKWGGFIDGVDEFDPLFFNISPLEAEILDPQERLFLQHAWMAIEDAGYTRAGLQIPHELGLAGQVGVYAGVMYSEYQLFGIEASKKGQRVGIPGSYASIANRVSYVLNLHGPSMTIDSMCSSSLTAIHLACQDLKQGRTSLAIAGGVNVSIHPNKYLVISAGQYISSDGHCQSFGEGGEGYIPGEGVGVVVLKRLSEAVRDGDHIYGVIKGSALNHGGKTNGYSVPNPQAQSNLISSVLAETNINPRHISYIEAHGTGTKLGDPIEIAALSQAFQRSTSDLEFCLIGSAKSNIGHCESAAGIAGLTKVLLQLKHRQIVPSLHSKKLNPNIDFQKTPFIVNQTLTAWEQPVIDGIQQPRLAGVSSFGAGGANAHIIVEEYVSPAAISQPVVLGGSASGVIIPLSARTPEQLRQKALDLLDFLRQPKVKEHGKVVEPIDLIAMAYTLQTGREAMDLRLGFLVSSVEELIEKLQAYVNGEENIEDVYQGQTDQDKDTLSLFNADADFEQTVEKWIVQRKLSKLVDLWAKGLNLDWRKFYGDQKPGRISLPTYPFAKDRYWVDIKVNGQSSFTERTTSVLHPLLHSNTSDLSSQRYSSVFTGREFFLEDHQVKTSEGQVSKVLPAVAYLEMARVAIEKATSVKQGAGLLELRNTAWAQPIVVTEDKRVDIGLFVKSNDEVTFEIYSKDGEQEIVHCQGIASYSYHSVPQRMDIRQLKDQMGKGRIQSAGLYSVFTSLGLVYGPAYQGITELYQGEKQVLAELVLPPVVRADQNEYTLHPSLMDSSLQAALGLIDDSTSPLLQPLVPFALDTIRIMSASTENMYAWVRYSQGSVSIDAITKLDIDICDQEGNVCVQMRGLSFRQLGVDTIEAKRKDIGILIANPVWETNGVFQIPDAQQTEAVRKHIMLCEIPGAEASRLEALIRNCHCIQLEASQKNIAERYSEYALTCFEQVREIIKAKPEGRVHIQIVIAGNQEQVLFSGLSGLLRTAAQENPKLTGQVILTTPGINTDRLAEQLQKAQARPEEAFIKYEEATDYVLRWKEAQVSQDSRRTVFKDQGAYLITGGLGALGLVFTREILQQTNGAKIILTGRSELTEEKQAILNGLPVGINQVVYKQVDLDELEQVKALIADIKKEYRQLNGIIHSAGMISDNFILKKTNTEFSRVLAPKVTGTYNLDEASKDIELDFMVLFSSLSGAMGNLGQADYATANAFMDRFALYRNQLVDHKNRHGRTLSINWPLWKDGHLSIDQGSIDALRQATGIQPMQTLSGVRAFYSSMALQHSQALVMEGDVRKMRRILLPATAGTIDAVPAPALGVESNTLVDKTIGYLCKQFAGVLKLPVHKLDPKAPLENYGIDSILAMRLTSMLEETFGSLSKTLFFEYQTIKSLAGFFAKAYPHIIQEKVGIKQALSPSLELFPGSMKDQSLVSTTRSGGRFLNNGTNVQREVAIVGLSGKYPLAENLQEFWENLINGRDCITDIPEERWDARRFYDPKRNQAGKSYSKWGGFISDVDKFDPLFFNISPKEAELIDPQERLFIETVWQTFEDAGYSKEGIAALGRVGVYVGVMYGEYQLYGAEAMLAGNTVVPGSSYASIANRVSYFFDLHGPSIALDTMCSSSLTAIHQACEEIRRGEIEAAIAGGVNVSIHPHKYLLLSQGNFASSDGRCRSFGEGGDGYVAGEGVGAILLKSLDKAIADGDQIYGVIKSSVINHGGKTNGYSVPNPNAQGNLILEALKKAKIDPSTLSYIETHGTGTALGDPIEITGLRQAFGGSTAKMQFCPIGSVKSNIGHLESAAGIAAVTKVLLQLRHKKLVPSLHATTLNSNIDFNGSPFYVQRELADWESPAGYPRRAGVSSFGAGGSNAHLIIEEYRDINGQETRFPGNLPQVLVLSAKSKSALLNYAGRIAGFIRKNKKVSITDMAYTLQVGRSPMNERLVIVGSSVNEFGEKLDQWLSLHTGKDQRTSKGSIDELEGVYHGNIKDAPSNTVTLLEGEEGRAYLKVIMETRNLEKLARLWISGADIDWSLLYQNHHPKRISLPTYPFARERYWISTTVMTLPTDHSDIQKANKKDVPGEERQKLYYYPEWIERNLGTADGKSFENRPILVLDSTDELFLAVKEQSKQYPEESPFILVKPGLAYQEIEPSVFSIDPQQEEHFKQLVEDLDRKGRLPYRIIHRGLGEGDPYKQEDITRQLSSGVYTLFNLCKALMLHKHQIPLQILSVYSSSTSLTMPQNAAIGGFFKTLALENPHYRGKIVEVQEGLGGQPISASEEVRIILNEFRDGNWKENEVRYKFLEDKRTYGRYVRELVQFAGSGRNTDRLPLKQNGVFIVSGGLGGLGLVISEYLVKNYQCKLVLFGRSALKATQEEKLERLKAHGTEVIYLRADASKLEDMEMVVKVAKDRFAQINGVIHSAGINIDSFILRKSVEEINKVLAPKIYGAINLDLATREENLDAFVLFSSIAGVMGNIGQCDYAYANHFLDSFAECRAELVREQKRFGKTLSINWPYWEEGGMHISSEEIALIEKQAGICPLPAKEGIQYLEELLVSDLSQCIPLYGFPSRIRSYIQQGAAKVEKTRPVLTGTVDADLLLEKTVTHLKTLIGEAIKLDPERLDPTERFESFGIDSIIISRINTNLESELGALPKTLFYEYATIEELAMYLIREEREVLIRFFNLEHPVNEPAVQDTKPQEVKNPVSVHPPVKYEDAEPIAIIGVHGIYPQSEDLNKYWENLKRGKDLTDLVPTGRWNCEEFYHEDPEKAAEGKIYCKWGGFINDVDKFDPHFFNITPEEAKIMDPQERLFLQSVWSSIEDAGYTVGSLKKRHPKAKSADVGVFVGVTTNTYNLLASEEWSKGSSIPSAHPWSIANRVSYLFDFNGPSMPVDTACSSSSVAIHLACESLRKRECQVAVAGGVNLYLHPSKYHSLCKSRMVSQGGKCHSYGAGDDGFVPGEGVGSVLLKPLSKAVEDGDHIYAVLAGSAFDHSGRSNGYSAPNPNAQANLIEYTLQKAQIHPETISYIEGHGTGTQLGDSLEIVALTRAFRKQTGKKQFSSLGSVKANIGHPESAAGIAGVTKVLLQMKHQQLAPTINSDKVNPNIEFRESPFYLQHQLTSWEPSAGYPRRALINSFGAGGVNACLVLEEYKQGKVTKQEQKQGPHLIVLSAKNKDRLQEYVNRLLTYLGKEKHVNLSDLSFTLQTGREAMMERLAIVVSDRGELIDRLKDWRQQKPCDNLYQGTFDPRQGRKRSSGREEELRTLFEAGNLVELAQLWITGVDIDWDSLYTQSKPRRISLPTYPFAKDRYWVSDHITENRKMQHEPRNVQLHPLVSYNSSTLKEVSFSSLLSDSEFYALDHQVNGEKIFPGSGFIEIANISGNLAGERKVRRITDIVWAHPLSFRRGSQFVQTYLKPNGKGTEFSITSFDDENERIVHSEGRLFFQNGSGHAKIIENIPLQKLMKQCADPQDGSRFYNLFNQAGFKYGSAFKTIREFYVNGSFALSKLKLADHLKADLDRFILHPCIVDGALQTVAGLVDQTESSVPYVPFAIDEIEIFRSLPHTCYAYVEHGDLEGRSPDIKKFNIKITNEGGDILASIKNFYVRAFGKVDTEQVDLLVDPYLIK